jgi:hypothetical protein
MPKQYEDIKQSYLDSGKSLKDAKSIAAATYIKNGKSGNPSSRAKSLQADKTPKTGKSGRPSLPTPPMGYSKQGY